MKSFFFGRLTAVAIVGFALGATQVHGEDDGSSFPIFNPFAKKSEAVDEEAIERKSAALNSARISDDGEMGAEEEGGFKWPSLPRPKLPTIPKPSLPKIAMPAWAAEKEMTRERVREPIEPSTWEKMTSGTKEMFSKTKQTLMPWTQEDESTTVRRPATQPRRSPPKVASRSKPRTSTTEKKPLFPWFTKKEKEEPFKGVNEFLSQPRP